MVQIRLIDPKVLLAAGAEVFADPDAVETVIGVDGQPEQRATVQVRLNANGVEIRTLGSKVDPKLVERARDGVSRVLGEYGAKVLGR